MSVLILAAKVVGVLTALFLAGLAGCVIWAQLEGKDGRHG